LASLNDGSFNVSIANSLVRNAYLVLKSRNSKSSCIRRSICRTL